MKTFFSTKSSIVALILLIISACSRDPLAATEANYRLGIEEQLAKRGVCIDLGVSMPHTEFAASHWPTWERLVQLGLLTERDVFEPYPEHLYSQVSTPLKLSVKSYQLSDKAKQLSKENAAVAFISRASTELCIGHMQITKIKNIDGPKKKRGASYVELEFEAKISGLEPWFTDNKEFFFALDSNLEKEMSKKMSGEQAQKIILVLTNKGWRSADLIKDGHEVIGLDADVLNGWFF